MEAAPGEVAAAAVEVEEEEEAERLGRAARQSGRQSVPGYAALEAPSLPKETGGSLPVSAEGSLRGEEDGWVLVQGA